MYCTIAKKYNKITITARTQSGTKQNKSATEQKPVQTQKSMILPDVFNRSVRLRMASPAFTLFFGPRLTSDGEHGELLAYKSFLE